MGAFERVLIRTFGRPDGILGRLGGTVMAKMNQPCAAWAIGLLRGSVAVHREVRRHGLRVTDLARHEL